MDDRIVKSPQEASQGQKPGVTRYVLTVGLVLVVILFVVAYSSRSDRERIMALLRSGLAIVLAMSATACGVGAPERASDIQNVNAISDDIAAVRMTHSPSRVPNPNSDTGSVGIIPRAKDHGTRLDHSHSAPRQSPRHRVLDPARPVAPDARRLRRWNGMNCSARQNGR